MQEHGFEKQLENGDALYLSVTTDDDVTVKPPSGFFSMSPAAPVWKRILVKFRLGRWALWIVEEWV